MNPRRWVRMGAAVWLLAPGLAAAQQSDGCALLCVPEMKIEPTLTFENLVGAARIESAGVVAEAERETLFELVFAVEVPTEIPRVSLTFEAIFAPLEDTDNAPELESELNFDLVDTDDTGGWLSSHLDIIDKFSPAETPGAGGEYTHKLNFELDTAIHVFSRLPDDRWLHDAELEASIDYVATGLPAAGDLIGGELFLDDASPWSLSLVFVLPFAPLKP